MAQSQLCEVCASPNANTLHFGGRSCKACAAFFRRTVSHDMKYECVNGGLTVCKVHFELRMICRQCRFILCLRAGMKKNLVQARRDENQNDQQQPVPTTRKRNGDGVRIGRGDSISISNGAQIPSPTTVAISISSCIHSIGSSVVTSSPVGLLDDCQQPSTSSTPSTTEIIMQPSPSIDFDEERALQVVEHHVNMEASLNDRRRIMYTDVRMPDVFGQFNDVPYAKINLRPFDYRNFVGFNRHDFVMLYDFAKAIPRFDELAISEKNILYRFSCAVDCMINSAYYTSRLGFADSRLILFNGEFVCMNPLPPSGNEEGAESMFESKEDHDKYKSLMPVKHRQWLNMAVPFSQLEVTFEEFCLLKALTIWHISYYRFSANGRSICTQQRDELIFALHHLCLERGISAPVRVGNLLLAMSYILEQVEELTNSWVLITFFNLFHFDPKLEELVNLPSKDYDSKTDLNQ